MIAEPQIAGFFAALARTAAWGMSSPIIGDRTVPARVRIIGVASLALAMSSLHGEVRYASLPAILPLELLLGVIAGFAGRLVFAGIESGGQLIGMELGLGFAGTMDPTAGEESLPTRRLAYALGGIAFVEVGGIEASFRVLALASPDVRVLDDALPALFAAGGRVFVAALRLAAPLLLASVVANVTMAISSRAAPAMNVFSVMLALFLVIGGATLIATAPALVRDIVTTAESVPQSIERTVTP